MPLEPAQRDWLTLALVPGVGTANFIRLLARFRTPRRVLTASAGELQDVVSKNLAQRIKQYGDVVNVEEQERRMDEYGVRFITLDDPDYPVRLAEIYDPPLALFVRGDLFQADEHCVAIVGTRHPTPYGIRMAEQFGRELAGRGITVVSGMAQGIDAAAHRGALEAGGRTIAVLGCGVDVVFPAQHAELMHQIIQQGCVISEFEMGIKALGGNFPQRNRIISGMTMGTLIVEAPPHSGALITAKQAAEQGREVFAIPGQIGIRNSLGPHALIREGAKLVETAEDILVELKVPAEMRVAPAPQPAPEPIIPAPAPKPATTAVPKAASPPRPAEKPKTAPPAAVLTPVEKDVLSALAPEGSFVDEIAQACRISVSEALSSLTMLELKGLARQFSGKRFAPR
ncbi:MAG: DNA-protecting protein DprA [Candidatus Hydrogenedentes bacterium]|nr:DNA-protecting protein DprA [Candidatus Hydrogenedentota bacterium]